jgi:raffinose/stachyose/melibiose transport system permease protein
MKQATFQTIAKQVVAILVSLVVLLPFAVILVNSVKSQPDAALMRLSLPEEFVWENYAIAIEEGRLVPSFFNSVIYSSSAVVLILLASALASFVLARKRTRARRALYSFFVFGILLPTNFVTVLRVMQWLSLLNSRAGVILLYSATGIAFGVFVIYGFVRTIPKELDEAAHIDGASPIYLFLRLILPLLQPVLLTAGFLQFLRFWNEFLIPLYLLTRSRLWPMTLAIYGFFGRYEQQWNLVFADVVMTIFPVFVIYLFVQRRLVDGLMSGSIKG